MTALPTNRPPGNRAEEHEGCSEEVIQTIVDRKPSKKRKTFLTRFLLAMHRRNSHFDRIGECSEESYCNGTNEQPSREICPLDFKMKNRAFRAPPYQIEASGPVHEIPSSRDHCKVRQKKSLGPVQPLRDAAATAL